jgi:hypothetical protein
MLEGRYPMSPENLALDYAKAIQLAATQLRGDLRRDRGTSAREQVELIRVMCDRIEEELTP